MPDTLNCPNCGAPLDYKGSDPIIRCPFCNSSVIVPDNLRGQPSFSSQPHNFTLTGSGNMNALINQARRFKEVKEFAQAGKEEEAVRVYMEITGTSADVARSAVAAMLRGMPIKLTDINMNFSGSVPPVVFGPSGAYLPNANPPIPTNNYDPLNVNERPAGNLGRTIGCGIGCFTVGIVILILIATLVPTAAGLMGVAVSLKPDMVLTLLPAISQIDITPQAPIIAKSTNTPEARKSPTPVPSATEAFAYQLFSFGKTGTDQGSFASVRAIAVDPSNSTIFAANYEGGRVQAFDPQGKYITEWVVPGNNPLIQDMAADHKGNLFIVVSGNILVYNAQGKLQSTIKPASLQDHYEDVAVLKDGSLMVVSFGENILHITTTGKVLSRIDKAISHVIGKPELDSKIAVDGSGNTYLLGSFSNSIFIFSAQGKFIRRFGSDGDQAGQLRAPLALAIDPKGRIFVSDFKGVQVFSNDGTYNNVLKVRGAVFGLAFDDQGSLYLSSNSEIVGKYKVP